MRAALEALRAKPAGPTMPPLESVLANLGNWSRLQLAEQQDVGVLRDVVALLVQRIIPERVERVERGIHRVQIDWTPLGEALRSATISELAERYGSHAGLSLHTQHGPGRVLT